jgi:transcriptional regulator with XRE-family HTH domain
VRRLAPDGPLTGRALQEVNALGQQIRRCREQRELTLRELARRVGVSASAISQIELGRTHPTLDTLHAVAYELGVSLDELFGRKVSE